MNCFIFHIKTDDIYKILQKITETGFNTLNYEIDRQLPMRNN